MIWTNRLLAQPAYQADLKKLEALEQDRIYCRHDLTHFLAVARIARILTLERSLSFEADVIYLTALLHDLGRIDEYLLGVPHHIAGIERANTHLDAIGYFQENRLQIINAIRTHRGMTEKDSSFPALFMEADKASRPCLFCSAQDTCHWPEEKKNIQLRY